MLSPNYVLQPSTRDPLRHQSTMGCVIVVVMDCWRQHFNISLTVDYCARTVSGLPGHWRHFCVSMGWEYNRRRDRAKGREREGVRGEIRRDECGGLFQSGLSEVLCWKVAVCVKQLVGRRLVIPSNGSNTRGTVHGCCQTKGDICLWLSTCNSKQVFWLPSR